MNNPKLIFDKIKIKFNYNDRQEKFNIYYLTYMLNSIMSINHISPSMKLKSCLFLFESNIQTLLGVPKIGFLPIDAKGMDVLNIFNTSKFRIIAGFAEQLKSVIPLEMKFEHRTDMIILFNSCDYELEENLRGTFNAPVFHADFFKMKQIIYKCNKHNYHIVKKQYIEHYKDNLYTLKDDKEKYFILSSQHCDCNNRYNIIGRLCYSLKPFIKFIKKDKQHFYYPKDIFEYELIDYNKYILSIDINIKNDTIIINALYYNKEITEEIKEFMRDFIKKHNLIDYSIEIKTNRFN